MVTPPRNTKPFDGNQPFVFKDFKNKLLPNCKKYYDTLPTILIKEAKQKQTDCYFLVFHDSNKDTYIQCATLIHVDTKNIQEGTYLQVTPKNTCCNHFRNRKEFSLCIRSKFKFSSDMIVSITQTEYEILTTFMENYISIMKKEFKGTLEFKFTDKKELVLIKNPTDVMQVWNILCEHRELYINEIKQQIREKHAAYKLTDKYKIKRRYKNKIKRANRIKEIRKQQKINKIKRCVNKYCLWYRNLNIMKHIYIKKIFELSPEDSTLLLQVIHKYEKRLQNCRKNEFIPYEQLTANKFKNCKQFEELWNNLSSFKLDAELPTVSNSSITRLITKENSTRVNV